MIEISIVIVLSRHEEYIEQCLDSISAQYARSIEVICVDGGSTRDTKNSIRKFSKFPLDFYAREGGGISDCLNYGLSKSKGEYIITLSAGDILLPGSILSRVDALKGGKADIVCGLADWIDENGQVLKPWDYPKAFSPFRYDPVDMFKRLYYQGNFICASSVSMTRKTMQEIGPYNFYLNQQHDYEMWIRACALGKRFECLDNPLVGCRSNGENSSNSDQERDDLEEKFILESTPKLLSNEFMREILFGKMHYLFDLDLYDEELRALVMLSHPKEIFANAGKDLLSACASNHIRRKAIFRSLLI